MGLKVSGIALTVTTVIDIIQKAANTAILVAPAFKDLLEAAMSTFSQEDREKIEAAYEARMAKSDADFAETDAVLAERAGEGDASE